jgi:hypothetical protein
MSIKLVSRALSQATLRATQAADLGNLDSTFDVNADVDATFRPLQRGDLMSGQFQNDQLYSWSSDLPDPLNVPQNGYFDFGPYSIGAPEGITDSQALPTGVVILGPTTTPSRATWRLEDYPSGTAQITAGVAGHQFTLQTSAEADWAARSTGAGVFYAHNMTWQDQAKTVPITNLQGLLNSCGSEQQLNGLAWDSTIKLSGAGSMRCNMPAAQSGLFSNLGFSWEGIGVKTKNLPKHEFYFQFAYYAHSVYRDFFFGTNNVWGGKICIIKAMNDSFSNNGEVVLRRTPRGEPGGFTDGYWLSQGGQVNAWETGRNSTVSDWAVNPWIDRGSPVITDLNSFQRRKGLNYGDGATGGLGSYYNSASGTDADIEIAAQPRLVPNGWTVFEVYIRQPISGQSILKVWSAPYGQAPQLMWGSMAANLPPVGYLDGQSIGPTEIYSGFQFLNYHNGVSAWPTQDTFVCYTEALGSDNPINFPGGFALPFPGTQVPS